MAFHMQFWTFVQLLICSLLYLCGTTVAETHLDLSKLLIVVISQQNEYHSEQAQHFLRHIDEQISDKSVGPGIELTHARWPGIGSWTITPILKDIYEDYEDKEWVLFCLEGTRIKLHLLQDVLGKHDPRLPVFLGRGLRDEEPTIIHHFAFHQDPTAFVYPDLAAGILFSRELVRVLVNRLVRVKLKSDFSIDAIHELAMYIRNNDAGYQLTEDAAFCAGNENSACATTYTDYFPKCGRPVSDDSVFFAVKTCTQFHQDRVPVVKETWGKRARHLVFYSDTRDASIPTEDTGIPNTERGHCGKMMVIMNRFNSQPELRQFDWLVIADDDTILSVDRLLLMLACYSTVEPVALGERYGYSVSEHYGYNYITGGGGMVLNRPAVRLVLESETCACSADDSPDDMTLGMCLKQLSIPITHSPLFHQARPDDYAKGLLQHQRPVSFHKHWMIDPVSVYNTWFATDDQDKHQEEHQDKEERDEL